MSSRKLPENFLEGKKIIITGGSSGIGKTLAYGLADLGASVGLMARSEDKLSSIVEEIRKKGQSGFYARADISIFDEVESAMETLHDKLNGIDVLINNAGVMRRKKFEKYRTDQIDMTIDTNLKGVLYGIQAALPNMIKQKSGSIISTGSISSLTPVEGMTVYGATKIALNFYSQSLAMELKQKKITVNTLLCGFIDTPMLRFGITEENARALAPLQPEQLIPYYAYFSSDKSKRVTGCLVNVDDMEKNVLGFIDGLENSKTLTFKDMEPALKEKLNPDSYKNARKNRKILSFLSKL